MKRQAGARIFSVALTLLLTVSIAVPRFATARAETPKEKLDRITAALQVTKSEIAKSEKLPVRCIKDLLEEAHVVFLELCRE